MNDFPIELPRAAWLHRCGALNAGTFAEALDRSPGEHASCSGCLFEVKNPSSEVIDFDLVTSSQHESIRRLAPDVTEPATYWMTRPSGPTWVRMTLPGGAP